ncbi:MAG: Asp23/Gls24 family envelope stress response protein [Clostridia bacterium]|nr:Asp23/Gls24 family envelope stress response protein [Clostridia bacterium]
MNENNDEIISAEFAGTSGSVRISAEVVSTIAGIAAEESKGVAYMYTSFSGVIAEKLGTKKGQTKGVRVEMNDGSVSVDVYIVIKYGMRVNDVAAGVQESIKNNIETMTGLDVSAVNVHIEGVCFEKAEKQVPSDKKNEIIADETEDDIED